MNNAKNRSECPPLEPISLQVLDALHLIHSKITGQPPISTIAKFMCTNKLIVDKNISALNNRIRLCNRYGYDIA